MTGNSSKHSNMSVAIDRSMATLAFDAPVDRVAQVSTNRAGVLKKLGISSVRDLANHFPRRYMDLSAVKTVADARVGESCTVAGEVFDVVLKRPKPRLTLVEITLLDSTGAMVITCFRQPWLKDKLSKGMRIAVAGQVSFNYGMKRMTNPFLEVLGEKEASGQIVPVHPATEKISPTIMRGIIRNALDMVCGIEDFLPLDLREKYRLMSRGSALESIHFPSTMSEQHQARRRLAYEEVLLLQLHLMKQDRLRAKDARPVEHVVNGPKFNQFYGALPFSLTEHQFLAVQELVDAMSKPFCANHMLLGDVGTGKTVVAGFGLCVAADTGKQSMMMAPTEVLARQYAVKLGPLLDAAGVTYATLTGSTDSAERMTILQRAASGELDVLFGTHALLEPDVNMPNLSFVVIDEQQRFGVEQREAIVEKGAGVDVLSMTATPIPRSLALTVFGNMTLSYISQRPSDVPARTTKVCDRDQANIAYEEVRQALSRGEQAYIVCPLVGATNDEKDAKSKGARQDILAGENDDEHVEAGSISIEDESDMLELDPRAVETHAEFLANKVLQGASVAILHGKLSNDEKHQVMDKFRAGEIQVLVCTTVIEVGVDVPNATVMVVEDADRFGLSQLHQLRGRVGRGSKPGSVFLISSSRAPVAVRRLGAMERSEDGFELSEFDLSLRHEGDILGNRQHGASTLKLVNVVRDKGLIQAAHDDARAIIDNDPLLSSQENRALAYEVQRMFGSAFEGGKR